MIYVIAWLLPPVAILFKGKPFQAFFCATIWIVSVILCSVGIGFIPLLACIIWAVAVVGGANADRRTNKIVHALRR
jgi:hypothetical protein